MMMSSSSSSSSSSNNNVVVSRQFLRIVLVALGVYYSQLARVEVLVVHKDLFLPSPLLSSAPVLPVVLLPAAAAAEEDHKTTNINDTLLKTTRTFTTTTTNTNTTNNTILSVCFITSVYGKWATHADTLQNLTETLPAAFYQADHVHFFVYTNLPRLIAPGWVKVIRKYKEYQRYITQSRYIKFWAWNEPDIQNQCRVVFYMDSIGTIIGSSLPEFEATALAIWESPQGHAQYLHKGGGGAVGEFRRIQVFRKDTRENIQASLAWLHAQPDFGDPSHKRNNCTLYENRYIGYAVGRPTTFATAVANCLWPRYSLELDSWRDQPLWCYCLDRHNITPIPLEHQKLWVLQPRRMGKAGHKYTTKTKTKTTTEITVVVPNATVAFHNKPQRMREWNE